MMRVTRVTYTFAIGLALAIGSVGSASALPFTNGSFEQGPAFSGGINLPAGSTAITGWEIFGSDIDVATVWQASDGLRSVDLNGSHGPAGIRQTFDTQAGALYRVDFDFSINPDGPAVPQITMHWDFGNGSGAIGIPFPSIAPTRADMQWQTATFFLPAIADSTTLSFFSTINSQFYGPTLDNVRVQLVTAPVPEPATLSLLAIGLAGVAVRRRRV